MYCNRRGASGSGKGLRWRTEGTISITSGRGTAEVLQRTYMERSSLHGESSGRSRTQNVSLSVIIQEAVTVSSEQQREKEEVARCQALGCSATADSRCQRRCHFAPHASIVDLHSHLLHRATIRASHHCFMRRVASLRCATGATRVGIV